MMPGGAGNSDTNFNLNNCTIYSNDNEPKVDEDIDDEESIKEEICMDGSFNAKNKDRQKPTVTPGTIQSNKQKLNRGISRENEFANGTLLNFGGQSTRSTFMKTPMMFGQNAHAKLQKMAEGTNIGPAQ